MYMCNGLGVYHDYIHIASRLWILCIPYLTMHPTLKHWTPHLHNPSPLRRFLPMYHPVPRRVPPLLPPLLRFCFSSPRWLENEGEVGKPASTVITLTKPVTPPAPVTPTVSPAPAPSTAPPTATPSPSVKPPPTPTPPAVAPSPEKSEPMPIDNDAK